MSDFGLNVVLIFLIYFYIIINKNLSKLFNILYKTLYLMSKHFYLTTIYFFFILKQILFLTIYIYIIHLLAFFDVVLVEYRNSKLYYIDTTTPCTHWLKSVFLCYVL